MLFSICTLTIIFELIAELHACQGFNCCDSLLYVANELNLLALNQNPSPDTCTIRYNNLGRSRFIPTLLANADDLPFIAEESFNSVLRT